MIRVILLVTAMWGNKQRYRVLYVEHCARVDADLAEHNLAATTRCFPETRNLSLKFLNLKVTETARKRSTAPITQLPLWLLALQQITVLMYNVLIPNSEMYAIVQQNFRDCLREVPPLSLLETTVIHSMFSFGQFNLSIPAVIRGERSRRFWSEVLQISQNNLPAVPVYWRSLHIMVNFFRRILWLPVLKIEIKVFPDFRNFSPYQDQNWAAKSITKTRVQSCSNYGKNFSGIEIWH